MANYAGVTEGFLGGLNAGLNTLSTIGQLKAQAKQQQNQELLLQQEQEKQQRLQNLANSFAPVFSDGDNALIQLDQSRKDEQAGKSILQDFAKLICLPQDIRGPQVDSFAREWEQANGQPIAENVIGFLKKVKPEDGQTFINRIQAAMPSATVLSGTLSNPGQFRSSLAEIHAMPDPSPDAVQQNSQIAEYRRLQGEMKVLDGQINRGIMVLQKNPYPEAVQVVEPMLEVWQQRREQVSAQMKEFSTPFTLSPGSGRYTGFGDPIAQQPNAPQRPSYSPIQLEGGQIGLFEKGSGQITPTQYQGKVSAGTEVNVSTGTPPETLRDTSAKAGATEYGREAAKRVSVFTGPMADNARKTLDIVDSSLESLARTNTGNFAEMTKFFSNVAVSMGASNTSLIEKASDLRNLSANSSKLLVAGSGGSLGNQVSNKDLEVLQEQNAKLTDATQVAQNLLNQSKQVARKTLLAASYAEKVQQETGDVAKAAQIGNSITRARLVGKGKNGAIRYLPDYVEAYIEQKPDASIDDVLHDWQKLYK